MKEENKKAAETSPQPGSDYTDKPEAEPNLDEELSNLSSELHEDDQPALEAAVTEAAEAVDTATAADTTINSSTDITMVDVDMITDAGAPQNTQEIEDTEALTSADINGMCVCVILSNTYTLFFGKC